MWGSKELGLIRQNGMGGREIPPCAADDFYEEVL
jgi:hypothetical protein